MGAEVLTQPAQTTTTKQPRPVRLPPLWLLAIVAFILFVRTATYNLEDVTGYHCYALAFWGGQRAAALLPNATAPFPDNACFVPVASFPVAPFHALPAEYGPLALLVFLLPLVFPSAWYAIAFFIEMALVVLALTWLLDRYGAPGAGHVWLIYALIGDMALTAGRFDVIPATCVVIAVIAARRGRLPWAYVALALGALFKFYPVALLPLLLIESWRARGRAPLWRGPALFAAIVAVVEGLAAALDPSGLLTPLTFMSARCVQIESLPASIGFLWASILHVQPQFPSGANSTCELAPGLGTAQTIALALGLVAIALTIALFWRRRVSLGLAALLIVASLIIGSKVFSPQYILWLSPLVALEYGADAAALFGWGMLCLLTTLCFPFSYNGSLGDYFHQPPDVMVPVTAGARNLLLVALGGVTLWRHARPTSLASRVSLRAATSAPPSGEAP